MKKRGKRRGKFIFFLLLSIFILLALILILPRTVLIRGNVALIRINGVITSSEGFSFTGQASSEKIVRALEGAEEDPTIEAILLEINSPGGSAVASKEIVDAVKRCQKQKPVYALIREIGASGAYWIASAADKIIANELSIVGSVGVTASYLEFAGLLKRYNITYRELTSAKFKEAGKSTKELTEEERSYLLSKINLIHQIFLQDVVKNRKLSEKAKEEISQGKFFLGKEALNLGLIDAIGDFKTAEQLLETELGVKEISFKEKSERRGILSELFNVLSEPFFNLGYGIGTALLQNQFRIQT